MSWCLHRGLALLTAANCLTCCCLFSSCCSPAQIALQIGTKPKHWQWIALFEIAAAMVVVGMLAALSLLWQYWGILSGKVPYDDGTRQPLLDSDAHVRS